MTSFKDFVEDAQSASDPYRKRGCGVGRLLSTLPATDAEQVRQALVRPELTGRGIHTALTARREAGDPWTVPSVYTITRHRKGDCGCDTN